MKVQRRHFALVSFVVTMALLLVAESACGAKQSGSARAGDMRLSFSHRSGLSIWYRGEQVVNKCTVVFHDGQWKRQYYSIPYGVSEVRVGSAADGKTLRTIGGPADNSVSVEYSATVRADNTVTIDLAFELNQDVPMTVEYCALQMVATPIIGCPFVAKAGRETQTRAVPLVCRGPGIDAKTLLATRASEFSVESRLGTITLRTADGAAWLDVLDARKRPWASPQNPIFWMGSLGQKLVRGQKRQLSLCVSFSGKPPPAVTDFKPVGSQAPAIRASDVVIPLPPAAEPLIPAPKERADSPGVFTISRSTPIVVGDGAAPEDRRAAVVVRAELAACFGIEAQVRTSGEVKDWRGAIVIGEPWLNPTAQAACKTLGLTVSKQNPGAEGYVLAASPSGIVVAGCDRRGTYWGAQTLLQLLKRGKDGTAAVPCVKIRDWPDFEMRAVHWGLRGWAKQQIGFPRRMVERLLARHKVNTLFLECQWIRWKSHPEICPKGITPEEMTDFAKWANEHFIEVVPQIQSLGHSGWLLGSHPELAENPDAPKNYCPSNPDTYKVLFDIYREVETIFRPRYFHIGHDEVHFSDFGVCPRCRGKSPAQLFAQDVRKLRDYWAERNVPIMMWGDMLLPPMKVDACNGGPPLNIAEALDRIPKDVIICDWHYGASYEEFPSLDFWRRHGFRTVATPWYRLGNISNFTRAAKKADTMGVIGSTWCAVGGPEVEPDCLVRSFQYLYPLVYTADCMWNAGRRAPDALPYDPAERFLSALYPRPAGGPPRPGFLVDLSPYCTRALADKPNAPGWLGYGPTRDLRALPIGGVRLGDTAFSVASGERNAVMLWGTFAGKAALPVEVKGIAIGKRAAKLLFLHVCGWAAKPTQRVGVYRVHYEDGAKAEIPLVYARNIAEATYPSALPSARVAWQGKMGDGTPVKAYLYEWQNPNTEKPIASLDFVSARTRAAPTLLGLSVVSP